MPSIFSKIIAGEIPCYKIAENEQFFAFLDINPVATGHTLVVPKKEVDYIFDLDNSLLADLMVYSKKIGKAIESVVPCERIGITVLGLEVPHAHVHLVPLTESGFIDFRHKIKLESEQFVELAERISAAVESV